MSRNLDRNLKVFFIGISAGAIITLCYSIWEHDKVCPDNPVKQESFKNSGKWVFSKDYIPTGYSEGTKVLITTSFGSPIELYNYRLDTGTDCVSGNSVQTNEFILICGTYQLQFLEKEYSNE